MAYIYQKEEEENNPQGGMVAKPLGQESAMITGSQKQAPGSPSSSGSFTNLQSYLDANSGNRMGEQVAGRIKELGDKSASAQGEVENAYKSRADQKVIRADDGLFNEVKADPTKVAADENKLNSFAKLRDARYTGPKNLADESDLYQKGYEKTQASANAATQIAADEGGRKAFLDQQYGSGAGRYDYTSGMKKLDNLLIQNDLGARKQLEDARVYAKDAQTKGFEELQKRLNQYSTGLSAETDQTRAKARDTVGINEAGNWTDTSYHNSLKGDLATRATAANQQKAAEVTAGAERFKTRQLTDSDKAVSGLTNGRQVYGAELERYVKAQADADTNSIAKGSELAKIQALSKLANVGQSIFNDPSRVGTFDPTKNLAYDRQGAEIDVNGRAKNYMDTLWGTKVNAPSGGAFREGGPQDPAAMVSLPVAMQQHKAAAEKALGYRDPNSGVLSNTFKPYVINYNKILDQIEGLQKAHHYDDVIGGGKGPESLAGSSRMEFDGKSAPAVPLLDHLGLEAPKGTPPIALPPALPPELLPPAPAISYTDLVNSIPDKIKSGKKANGSATSGGLY